MMNDRLSAFQQDGQLVAFEKHEDTPTVTFVGTSDILTLPYHALRTMRRDPTSGQIQLEIDAMRILLQGSHLHPLWRALQVFQVREIHESENHEEPMSTQRAVVRKIVIENMDEEPPA